MQNDYEILGLSPGAKQGEIKKAYFKLVREFSPEKDPERFQEIRGAYERLKQAEDEDRMAKLNFEMPTDPEAETIFYNIQKMINLKEYKKASSEAERAIKRFGECEPFLYLRACSQRIAGNPGKAIKSYEKLVKLYPGKIIYKKGLAFAYYDRGFTKKALTAFQDAYEAGVKDVDFILQFSMCCRDREEYEQGLYILLKLVQGFDNATKNRDLIEDYMEAYMSLFGMNFMLGSVYFEDITSLYIKFLKMTGRFLKKYDEIMIDIAFILVMTMPDTDCMSCVKEILKETEKYSPKENFSEQWKIIEGKLIDVKIESDSRLGVEIKWCWEAFILSSDVRDKTVVRFWQTDCKLLIVERMPEIKEELEVVKNEYPELYEKMKSFYDQLEREDISYIKEKLLKDYNRVEKYFEDGHYYELYPEERLGAEKVQWNSSEHGSFTRGEKKVGRNDPCPCGSGKKYKQCCGRK